MSSSTCGSNDEELEGCRDDTYAIFLKMVAIAAILVSGSCGVAIPLFGKKRRFFCNDSNLFVATKAFAAGVILATGFVHMLPDATEALTDSCLPEIPWSKFPFSGFIAMMAALATSLADFVGTRYHKRKHEKKSQAVLADSLHVEPESGINETRGWNGRAYREEEGDAIQIVAMDVDAAHDVHVEPHEHGECEEISKHSHCRSHSLGTGHGIEEDEVRHIVVSQVLEFGIVSHSAIIGISLGVSHSPCVVRPLIAALSFHQFFEGLALGSCISQAKFKTLRSVLMACFFSLTTPIGIAIGIGISSFYDASSPKALITEGILDSISAGILVYMALVDLIAAELLSMRKNCSLKLQMWSYIALVLGAVSMSSLAIWA